jgi:transposase
MHAGTAGTWERRRLTRVAKSQAEAPDLLANSLPLEDLTGIRERTKTRSRTATERRRGNSWGFYQLRQFVGYTAALASVLVVLHPPAYTSQMCHACLHLGHRHEKRFTCTKPACGWYGDADWNAAQNLAILGLNLSQPRGPWLHCELQGSQKPQAA